MSLTIRRMNRIDLDRVLDWAAAEGWNPGESDAGPFFDADPDGFFIGELDGRPIGAVSAVAYGEHFGFVGLDGVTAMEAHYRKLDFKTAYRHVRHEGTAKATAPARLVDLGRSRSTN